jgi:gluconokinase
VQSGDHGGRDLAGFRDGRLNDEAPAEERTGDFNMVEELETESTPVLVLMGVSGCGKSTLAGVLAGRLGWDLAEGDDMHPPQNVAKMAAGHPLTDDDRWPWLDRVADWIRDHTQAGRPGIVTCSALKRRYRDVLRDDHTIFIYLRGSRDQIAARLANRHGHYMPASLLDSQFAALEPPGADERSVTVDVGGTPSDEADHLIAELHLRTETGEPT